ncbi:MAG: hypothetical protein KJN64_11005 [Ignavibacteria bacterium]|nr:hypothetical protein [Ignavibacteria bacterium]MBT8392909.1 hypothetical protein [Ignavibacteria bacterium]NNL21213.1 hypothetical protein [Ignavibacteriaceae bacterium]
MNKSISDYNCLKEWAKCYGDIILINDVPWHVQNRILTPLQMPHKNLSLDKLKLSVEMAKSNSILAHWTDKWDSSESEWWWICCDSKNYDIKNIKNSRGRRGIRKGLEHCEVKKINSGEFPELAYNLYVKSLKSYGVKDKNIFSKNEYYSYVKRLSKYRGYELWGSFVDNKLAAFAACVVLDDAVLLGSTKSDPEMHKFNPNNALFYIITKYYLTSMNTKYITNGHRTLVHKTSIDEFLTRMGYRKVFCRLNLELSKFAKVVNTISSPIVRTNLIPFKQMFPVLGPKIEGFNNLIEINKTFKES